MAGGTDYSTYLKIDDLLKLQVPLTPGASDELLFIVIHQSYEIWFKVIIDELGKACDALEKSEPWRALDPLRRMVKIEAMLLDHLRILETMSPEDFLEFRDPLNPASGFQSFQFRAIEFLSGAGNEAMLHFELFDEQTRAWLREMKERPSVWFGFEFNVRRWSGDESGELIDKLRQLYLHHNDATGTALHQIAELLMDHDEHLAMWRHQHMLMAGRQIGNRQGTGGSEGMKYLATTLSGRMYPLLWDVRSVL